ncbi:hypothetical protein [Marinilabilia rubra]|uniref:Uncharacterized protein n=1 Tax=Marinilabilia rubra TaxID=2162893 RepID=A0A2U2BCD4_9BACT|nr:hypothetical protein [Marinilabilia rubra]PWE00693.1 hypothetical protein DDZ16_03615 [Marinilabilia rubra]
MNEYQTNKRNMLEAVNSYLDEHKNKWQGIARLVDAKQTLTHKLTALERASEAQAEAKVSIGKSKLALKKTMAAKADIINDLVAAYAHMIGDNELARIMSDSTSALFRLSYDKFFIRVKSIIETATELKDVLIKDFGMQPEQLTDLQNDYNHLLEIEGQPRAFQIKSSIATNQISFLLGEAHNLTTKQIDKLISTFKQSDPNFYHGYKKARMIVQ